MFRILRVVILLAFLALAYSLYQVHSVKQMEQKVVAWSNRLIWETLNAEVQPSLTDQGINPLPGNGGWEVTGRISARTTDGEMLEGRYRSRIVRHCDQSDEAKCWELTSLSVGDSFVVGDDEIAALPSGPSESPAPSPAAPSPTAPAVGKDPDSAVKENSNGELQLPIEERPAKTAEAPRAPAKTPSNAESILPRAESDAKPEPEQEPLPEVAVAPAPPPVAVGEAAPASDARGEQGLAKDAESADEAPKVASAESPPPRVGGGSGPEPIPNEEGSADPTQATPSTAAESAAASPAREAAAPRLDGNSAVSVTGDTAAAVATADQGLVSLTQDRLLQLGYGDYTALPRSGVLDERTQQAILNYQRKNGLPATGRPSPDLLAHMESFLLRLSAIQRGDATATRAAPQPQPAPPVSGGYDSFRKGLTASRQGDLALAVDHLTRAIESAEWQERHMAYVARAKILARRGNHQQAVNDYSAAINLRPTYTEAWIGRGIAHTQLRRRDEAHRDLRQAQKLDPNNAFVAQALSRLESLSQAN